MNLSFIDTDMRGERQGEDVVQPPQHTLIWPHLNSTKHNPSWEAGSSSSSHEIPCTLRNLTVHLVLILMRQRSTRSPILLLDDPLSYLPSITKLAKQSLSVRVSQPTMYAPVTHTCHIPRPSPSTLSSEQYLVTSTNYENHYAHFSSLLLNSIGPNIFLSTPFLISSTRSSLNVREIKFHDHTILLHLDVPTGTFESKVAN